ncbi:MAG TPA: GFA family protein [Trichocoleus sp.]
MANLTGGCFCGAVRYHSQLPVIDASYCHCRICQHTCGAPVVAWVSVPAAGFSFTQGSPMAFESSAKGTRHFCSTCGTQLTFRHPNSAEVDITSASLDNPAAISPEFHVWTSRQLPWLVMGDALPRHEADESGS